jgi:hypothetical protein
LGPVELNVTVATNAPAPSVTTDASETFSALQRSVARAMGAPSVSWRRPVTSTGKPTAAFIGGTAMRVGAKTSTSGSLHDSR